MNSDTSESVTATRQAWTPCIILGAAVGTIALYAIIEAPSTLQTARRLEAERIQQEDREHCGKFRIAPGSEDFMVCVAGVAQIRQRQRDRSLAEAAGML